MQYLSTSIRALFSFVLVFTLSGCWFDDPKQSDDGASNAFFLLNSGGSIEIRRQSESQPFFSTTVSDGSGSLSTGQWEASFDDLDGGELLVVKLIGGRDVSAKALETSPDASVFAFATASDIEEGINVSPLTDVIWRVAHRYVERSHIEDTFAYLDSLTNLLLKSDIDGDGKVTYRDALAFDPNSPDHLELLSFDFNVLCCNASNYVNQALLGADQETLEITLQNIFGPSISFYQSSSISKYSTVTLLGIGNGTVLDESGETVYQSETHKNLFHVSKARDTSYFLTAYPEPGSEILKWNGCSKVSADKTQCELSSFKADRVVEVIFGFEDTVVSSAYVDLDGKFTGSHSPGQLLVDLPADADQRADLLGLVAGNFTAIFLNEDLYLIEVLNLTNLGSSVQIDFEKAGIFDVIEKGTALFQTTYDASDIVDIEYPSQTVTSSSTTKRSYQLSAVAGEDPNEIRLVAASAENESPSLSGGDQWAFPDGGLELNGSVSLEFSLDVALDASLADGTKGVMITPKLASEGAFSVLASGSLSTAKTEDGQDAARVRVARIRFAERLLFFSFVPVKVSSYIDVYIGANGEIKGSSGFEVKQEGSIALSLFVDSEGGWDLTPKSGFGLWLPAAPVAEGTARLRGYLELNPVVSLYGQGGPSFPTKRYVDYRASVDLFNECPNSIKFGLFTGNSVSFELNFSESDFFKALGFSPRYLSTNLSSSVEAKIAEGIVNSCEPFVPGTLMVAGPGIAETIEAGDSADITRTLEVRNNGGAPISWSANYNQDSHLAVQPDSGELDPGQSASLQVTFNNLGYDQIRTYENYISFSTNSEQVDAPVPFRNVTVDVVPYRLSRPEITKSSRTPGVPSEATIAWSIPEEDETHVFGFDIYQTQDPELAELDEFIKEGDEWELVGTYQADDREVVVSGLDEEQTFIVVQAFGNRGQFVQSESVELGKEAAHSLFADTTAGAFSLVRNGEWQATPVNGASFGNIDWKGQFDGDIPTRVLSWSGPRTRYFGDEGFLSGIYQGGKLFDVAPGNVHGAAILVDGMGEEWLVVVVNDSVSDTLYARPNEPSNSPDLYDPATNPSGWQEILSYPQVGETSGGWFFDQDGTEARAVRYVDSTITTNGEDYEVKLGIVKELTVSVSEGVFGIQNASMRTYTPENSTNAAVIAVDYNRTGSVELRRTTDNWLEVGGISIIPNSELQLYCFEGQENWCPSLAHVTSVGNYGIHAGDYALDGNGSRFINVYYLDLRTGFYAYSVGLADDLSGYTQGNYRVRLGGEVIASSETVEARGWAPYYVYYSFDDYSRVDAFLYTNINSFWLKGAMPPPDGSWAADAQGGLILSQTGGSVSAAPFNFINFGGNLTQLLGFNAAEELFNVGAK